MKIRGVAITVFIFPALLFAGEPSPSASGKKLNPHAGKGNCQICHVETEESLKSWSFFGSSKRKMKANHNAVCTQCHGLEFGHGVGKAPQVNIDSLPLDENGRITCALTCHDMHSDAEDPAQTRYHLRFPINRICESCHNNNR